MSTQEYLSENTRTAIEERSFRLAAEERIKRVEAVISALAETADEYRDGGTPVVNADVVVRALRAALAETAA